MAGNERMRNRWYTGLFTLLVLVLAILTLVSLNHSIQSDETYSLELMEYPWIDMIKVAAQDVHPPLYYMIVKVFVDAFGGGDLYHRLLVAKAASILSQWILLVLAATVIRRSFGRRVAILFGAFMIGLPSLIHINSQIRMYGWGMLFVTISGLMAVFIIQRKDTRRTWEILFFSSVAACYMHYFCDVAIFYVYVLLLIWMICKRREGVRALLIQAACVVIAYLPWMSALVDQVSTVSDDYWIEEINIASVLDYMKFFLAPYIGVDMIRVPLEILMIMIVTFAIIYAFRHEHWEILYLMAIVICVVLTGIIVSMVFRPVFVSRYAVPSCGTFCLGLAITLAHILPETLPQMSQRNELTRVQWVAVTSMLVIMAISLIDVESFVRNEVGYERQYQELKAQLFDPAESAATQGENAIIFTDSAYLAMAFAYYMPDVRIYDLGADMVDYYHPLDLPGNLQEYSENTPLESSTLWVVHSAYEDDTIFDLVQLSETEPVETVLEQTPMTIYTGAE